MASQADRRHQGGTLGGFERCRVVTCWRHWLRVAPDICDSFLKSIRERPTQRPSGGAYAASSHKQSRHRDRSGKAGRHSSEPSHDR